MGKHLGKSQERVACSLLPTSDVCSPEEEPTKLAA